MIEELHGPVLTKRERRRIHFLLHVNGRGKNQRARRIKIWNMTGGFCVYCNSRMTVEETTMDHIFPKAHGGTWALCNMLPACRSCNTKRGSKPASHFAHDRWVKYVTKKELAMGIHAPLKNRLAPENNAQ